MTNLRPLLALAASTLALSHTITASAQVAATTPDAATPEVAAPETPAEAPDIVVTGTRTTGRSRLEPLVTLALDDAGPEGAFADVVGGIDLAGEVYYFVIAADWSRATTGSNTALA